MIGENLLNNNDSQTNDVNTNQMTNFVQYLSLNEIDQNEIKFDDNIDSSSNKENKKDENKPNVEKENINSENQYLPKEETKIDKIISIAKNAVDTSLSFISNNIGSPFIKISQKVNLKCVELFGL